MKKNERNKIMNGEILNLHFLPNLFADFSSCRFYFSQNQKVKTISYLFFFFFLAYFFIYINPSLFSCLDPLFINTLGITFRF